MALAIRKRQVVLASAAARKKIGLGGPTYLPDLTTGTYAMIASTHQVRPGFNVPFQACAVGSAVGGGTVIDVPAAANQNAPDETAAKNAFGNTYEIHRYIDQSGNSMDPFTVDAARRHRRIATEAGPAGGITYDLAGNFYKIPDTLALDRQNVTIIQVMREYGVQVGGMVTAAIGGAAPAGPLLTLGSSVGLQAVSVGGNTKNYRRLPLTRQFFKAITCGPTATRFWRNDDNGPPTSAGNMGAAQIINGGALTASRNGDAIYTLQSTSKSIHLLTAFIVGEVSQAEMALIKQACYSIFGINTSYNTVLMQIGDSIGHGQGCTNAMNYIYHLEKMIDSANIAISNPSTPARKLSQQLPTLADFTNCYEAGKKMKVLLQTGTNDLGNGGVSAVNTYNNYFVPMINGLKAAGANNPGALTIAPRNDLAQDWSSAKETERLAYNQMLRDNGASLGVTIIDRAANPDLANPGNTTFFLGDQLHLTSAGYLSCANYEAAAVNAWLQAA